MFLITMLVFPAILFAAQKSVKLTTCYSELCGECLETKANKLKVGLNATTPASDGVMNFNGNPTSAGTDPASGHAGDLYYNASDKVFRYNDGTVDNGG